MRILSKVFLLLLLAHAASAMAQEKTRSVKFDSTTINYVDYGKGSEALVFVHCWSCNLGFWNENLLAFKDRTRIIALDLPGHGASGTPASKITMDMFARSVNAVMEDAGVRKAVLVGHSMGTPVIRQFYRLFPDKALALVIVDGSLMPFRPREVLDQIIAQFRGPDYKQAVERFVGPMTGTVKSPKTVEQIKASMLNTPQPVVIGAMEAMVDDSIWKDDPIRVPVLALMAPNPFWTAEYEKYVRSIAPNMEYQKWEGVSHFLMMDEPKKFNDSVTAFLVKNRLIGYK
jgi:pimeloyl-ACP methyl ester carboxylesterase